MLANITDQLQEIRSYWEFAAVSQFMHLFHEAFGLNGFDTEELEKQLLAPPPETRLVDLHIKMLRVLTGSRLITTENWQAVLARECEKRNPEDYPLLEGVDFFDLPLRNKVLILHFLCEWQFERPERLRSSLGSEEEAAHWRVEPVGYDAKGNTYWLFDDNRLYREAPPATAGKAKSRRKKPPSKPEPTWSLECLTQDDWETFSQRFAKSKNAAEKEFYEFLTDHALPKVLSDLQEKEKEKKLQEALVNRKRSSRLQMKELAQMEIDRQMELRMKQAEEERIRREREERRLRDEMERERKAHSREQRIAEREARLEAKRKGLVDSPVSTERSRRKTPRKKQKEVEEDNWYFDCICGVHGENLDDGTPMIACGRCNVWQHIRCLAKAHGQSGRMEEWAEKDFVCSRCQKREERERETVEANRDSTSDAGGGEVNEAEHEGVDGYKRIKIMSNGSVLGGMGTLQPEERVKQRKVPRAPVPAADVFATPLRGNGMDRGGMTGPVYPSLDLAGSPLPPTPLHASPFHPGAPDTSSMASSVAPIFAGQGDFSGMGVPHPASPAAYQPFALDQAAALASMASIPAVDPSYMFTTGMDSVANGAALGGPQPVITSLAAEDPHTSAAAYLGRLVNGQKGVGVTAAGPVTGRPQSLVPYGFQQLQSNGRSTSSLYPLPQAMLSSAETNKDGGLGGLNGDFGVS
ncbi:hypothetical protein HK104_000061 [Borealophlyctis nickersoniae]|nr:hypothetical protein HK104_000061 [Borealophlyctis nickersoniae]